MARDSTPAARDDPDDRYAALGRRAVLQGTATGVGALALGSTLGAGRARAADPSDLLDVAIYVDGHTYDDHDASYNNPYRAAQTVQTLLQDALEYNGIHAHRVTVVEDGGGFDVREYTTDPAYRPDFYGDADDGDSNDESDSDGYLADYEDADEDGVYERNDAGRLVELDRGQILDDFRQYLKANDLFADHEDHFLIYHNGEKLGGVAGGRAGVGMGDRVAELPGAPYDPPRYSETDRGTSETLPGDAARVSIHELGHFVGSANYITLGHGQGMHYTDDDVENGEVHDTTSSDLPDTYGAVYTTPLGAPDGGDNECGQPAASYSNYSDQYTDAYYWHGCSGDTLREDVPRQHLFTVESDDGAFVNYDVSVSGTIVEKSTDCGATINSGDSVSGSSASGQVNNGGRDSYVFTGEITGFSKDNPVNTYVNCEQVFVSSVGHDAFVVDGDDDGDFEHYDITVSGGLAKSTAGGASINSYDRVEGRTASGRTYAGKDAFSYWGGILLDGYSPGGASVTITDE